MHVSQPSLSGPLDTLLFVRVDVGVDTTTAAATATATSTLSSHSPHSTLPSPPLNKPVVAPFGHHHYRIHQQHQYKLAMLTTRHHSHLPPPLGGGMISAFKGWNTTPRGQQFQGMINAVRVRGPMWGGELWVV
jgi:hypothetical protein